jgi:hypothetical protein
MFDAYRNSSVDEYKEMAGNLKYLPLGDCILFLDQQIERCRQNRISAADDYNERMEVFYIEAEHAYRVFRKFLVDLFATQ